ncbi:MAG: hypothetical protein JXA10_12695 [Anaerolineae bacterium]|nr:hypothetical protein [Anaerolineae bacterium]
MSYVIIVAGASLCAFFAMRARQLIESALWLAGTSALVSIGLYALGAQIAAVIELSVGAGLVTVLFVFAISIAGDDALSARAFVPNWLAVGLSLAFVALFAYMVLPAETAQAIASESPFAVMVWDNRALDLLVQLVLIFTGVLCLLGLLVDDKPVTTDEPAQTKAIPVTMIPAGNGSDPVMSALPRVNGANGYETETKEKTVV